MDIKTQYSNRYKEVTSRSLHLNGRLFKTYNRIVEQVLDFSLTGVNVDLGCGDTGFSKICERHGITSFPYDYPEFNIESQTLGHENDSVDFITMNAVLEHIFKPDHIISEIKRVLKHDGLLFIRTPNWKMDFRNFYNDPTHVKPYSPQTLRSLLTLSGLEVVFLEPGLVEKNWVWWRLPDNLKWKMASLLKGGTKSLIAVAVKRGNQS